MSEPNVLVNYRLDQATPIRFRWLATDGHPGDGYKAQIVAIKLDDGARLAIDASAILEQVVPDPSGGFGDYLMTFTGMVGYAADHADRARVDKLDEESIDYEVSFIHEDGHVAEESRD